MQRACLGSMQLSRIRPLCPQFIHMRHPADAWGQNMQRFRRTASHMVVQAAQRDSFPIMVNSCSGKMGHATAEAVVRAGLELVPISFTGESEGIAVESIGVSGIPVELILPEKRQLVMEQVKMDYPGVLVIDYTLPSAVNENALFYGSNGVPFVMGTTGGDRQKLIADVEAAGVHAVIAPQMGKQVVAFQATMELMAEQFPGAFAGYNLQVVESHQRSKVDTSGTAKAIIGSFQKLGVDFNESQIEKVRDKGRQLDMMGVPEANLDGHAFHTYSLTSPEGSVFFSFTHNVCGRDIYAEGSVDAALFLSQQIQAKSSKKIFNMIDVLRAGSMR
mmetsp:Transcript_4409/g.12723  ORF Transcript_4409/g.12723 Transcript_4409/m.12723 type:complete len:332 (-) Transcript_4409:463-1458(-)